MKVAKIALRNLNRQKKRSFFIAFAIGLGVSFILIINAFTAGSIRNLKENFAQMIGGHVFINFEHQVGDKVLKYVDDDEKLLQMISSMNLPIKNFKKLVVSDFNDVGAQIVFQNKSSPKNFIGVDFSNDAEMIESLGLKGGVLDTTKANKNALVLNKKAAEDLKLHVGDDVLAQVKTYTGQDDLFELTLTAILEDDSSNSSFYAWVHKDRLRQALNLPGEKAYSSLLLQLDSVDDVEAIQFVLPMFLKSAFQLKEQKADSFASRVQKIDNSKDSFKGIRLEIVSINDFLAGLQGLANGLGVISVVLLLVLMGITFVGIWNTFKMIFFERIVEIGTLRAVGMQRSEIRRMILFEASFLSMTGYLVGLGLALLIALIASLISFPTDGGLAFFLNKGHFNFRFDFFTLFFILFLIVGFTLLAALGPARKAAKLSPAAALRTTN